MYVFGGSHGSTRYKDLWAYDVATNSWSKLTPAGSVPAARETASLAYNPNSGRAFLWGGYNGSNLDDAWAYDPPTNTWIAIPLSGPQPSGRSFSPIVYSSVGKRMILFGGFEYGSEIHRDTWTFAPATGAWTKLSPPGDLPDARGNHALAFATSVDKVILFGGTNDYVVFNDIWAYGSAP
jgi:N-acetylneuraminic acid mutarotase